MKSVSKSFFSTLVTQVVKSKKMSVNNTCTVEEALQMTVKLFGGHVILKNMDSFKEKIDRMSRLVPLKESNIHIVTDFDFTITQLFVDYDPKTRTATPPTNKPKKSDDRVIFPSEYDRVTRGASCHRIIEESGLLSDYYAEEANKLQRKYYPIEIDPNIPLDEKIKHMEDWVEIAHKLLLTEGKLTLPLVEQAAKEALKVNRVQIRPRVDEFFSVVKDNKLPCLFFSAGITQVLEAVLNNGLNMEGVEHHVISNTGIFNENKELVDFEHPSLHVFNKMSKSFLHTDYFQSERVKNSEFVFLIGDNLGDAKMSDGINVPPENILKIAFLNDKLERAEQFKLDFDILILGDDDFTVPLNLLKTICNIPYTN